MFDFKSSYGDNIPYLHNISIKITGDSSQEYNIEWISLIHTNNHHYQNDHNVIQVISTFQIPSVPQMYRAIFSSNAPVITPSGSGIMVTSMLPSSRVTMSGLTISTSKASHIVF